MPPRLRTITSCAKLKQISWEYSRVSRPQEKRPGTLCEFPQFIGSQLQIAAWVAHWVLILGQEQIVFHFWFKSISAVSASHQVNLLSTLPTSEALLSTGLGWYVLYSPNPPSLSVQAHANGKSATLVAIWISSYLLTSGSELALEPELQEKVGISKDMHNMNNSSQRVIGRY